MVVRTAEFKKLEQIYKENGSKLVLMYGTRVSGGRDLVKLFVRDKDCFYTDIPDVNAAEQKKLFMSDAAARFNVTLKEEDSFSQAFSGMKSSDGSKLVIVIDDYQYAVKQESVLLDRICKAKADKSFKSEVMIIVLINELSHIRAGIDDYLGNAAKAVDECICLEEMTFLDVVRSFPGYSVKEAVKCYGILGGNSDYLNLWNRKLSVKENVVNTMLNSRGPLFDAARDFLSSELRELSGYETILSSMARGNEKLNDLFKDTGYARAKLIVYLKNLEAVDAVEKVVSFETGGWDNAKKGVYRFKNQYLNFYFKYIYPHKSMLFGMDAGDFYDKFIAGDIEEYLCDTFVKVCREYLSILNLMGKTPINMERTGTWVGKEGTIDVIGQDSVRNNIVAKTNFDKAEFPYDEYEKLLENMAKARVKAKAVYLFSATEFDQRLLELSRQDSSVILIEMKEL